MQPKLLDQVRNAIRLKRYSIRTEQTYINWVKRFILFHNKQHPREMHNAQVIDHPLGDISSSVRAKRPKNLPVVLTREEVKRLITRLLNDYKLIGVLLYGSG